MIVVVIYVFLVNGILMRSECFFCLFSCKQMRRKMGTAISRLRDL